ncbi:MAG: hypothetical protein ACTSVI_13055 [Promethearchaeota archaeon]
MDEKKSTLNEMLETRELYEKYKSLHKKAQQDLETMNAELEKLEKANEELSKELNDKKIQLETLKIESGKDKEINENLNNQVADLKSRVEKLEEEISSLKNNIQNKENMILEKDKLLVDKDEIIKQKDAQIVETSGKISDLNGKVVEYQEQVIKYQKDNEDLKLKIKELEKQNDALQNEYNKLKNRLRESGDSVLGTTMEIEKLKNIISDKESKISELEGKLGSLLTGESGFLSNREDLFTKLLSIIKNVHRSIRLCVPQLFQVEDTGILSVIQEFPSTIVVNIAADIKNTDEHIVINLRERGVKFTQFDNKDRWVINRDGEEFLIALEKNDNEIIGFYSNEPKLVAILNSSIMEPWVKGIKI